MPAPHPTFQSPQAAIRDVAARLGLSSPTGRFLAAPCPVHDDQRPSLSLWIGRDGRLHARCFAGCSEQAVLAELDCATTFTSVPSPAGIDAEIAAAREAAQRTEQALSLWMAAEPLSRDDLVVARYLRGTRGLAPPTLPASLRISASLFHSWSGTRWPALVARVDDAFGEFASVHRTWIDPSTGDKAPIAPQRAMFGPQQHGAIRLFDNRESDELLVAEGVETALSAGEMHHWKCEVWAAISSSGLIGLHVPKRFSTVAIAADNDKTGSGMRAGNALAHRLRKRGVHTRVIQPAALGCDWNDVLRGRKQRAAS
jgi:hypothetical protein